MIGKYPASPGGGKDPFRREQHVSRVIARPAAIALSSTPTAADPAGARGSIPRPLRFAARREATRPGKRPVMHRAPQSNCHDSLTFKATSGAAVMNCLQKQEFHTVKACWKRFRNAPPWDLKPRQTETRLASTVASGVADRSRPGMDGRIHCVPRLVFPCRFCGSIRAFILLMRCASPGLARNRWNRIAAHRRAQAPSCRVL